MTRNDLHDAVSRWLLEEGAGDDREAEAALVRVFSALPTPEPPVGFADAVVHRAGVLVPAPLPSWAPRLARGMAAAALVLVGLAAVFLPLVLYVLGSTLTLGQGVEWAAAGLLAVCRAVIEALSFWDGLAGALATLGSFALKSPVLVTLVFSLLTTAIVVGGLHRWLKADRS